MEGNGWMDLRTAALCIFENWENGSRRGGEISKAPHDDAHYCSYSSDGTSCPSTKRGHQRDTRG